MSLDLDNFWHRFFLQDVFEDAIKQVFSAWVKLFLVLVHEFVENGELWADLRSYVLESIAD